MEVKFSLSQCIFSTYSLPAVIKKCVWSTEEKMSWFDWFTDLSYHLKENCLSQKHGLFWKSEFLCDYSIQMEQRMNHTNWPTLLHTPDTFCIAYISQKLVANDLLLNDGTKDWFKHFLWFLILSNAQTFCKSNIVALLKWEKHQMQHCLKIRRST